MKKTNQMEYASRAVELSMISTAARLMKHTTNYLLARAFILLVFISSLANVLGQDADGDGISDALDDDPGTMSGLVVSLNETDSILTHVGNISSDYPSLSFMQSEVVGTYGKVKIFTDGRFEYVANETHDALNLNAEREEIYTFTSDQGLKFHFLVKIVGTNDAAIISKLEYNIDATLVDQIEQASGYMRVKDKDANESSFVAQVNTQGSYGKFSINSQGVWSYASTSSHHTLDVGSSVSDSFTVATKDGTQRTVSITIQGSKNTDETITNGISHHAVPETGTLVLREEILLSGPYFTEMDGWSRNSATVQKLFKLNAGQRYSFRMEGITLKDSRLQVLGPIDESKTYSVFKQPALGTVTVNEHTGSWVYTANDGVTQNDDSTIQIGVVSTTPVLVPSSTYLYSSNAKRTVSGTSQTPSEYSITIAGQTIIFKASSDGTLTGNGENSDSLDPDMSFEIVADLANGATPTVQYDKNYPRLYIHVADDSSSTTAQVASAINAETTGMFFGASAVTIKEIDGVNLTSQRMNKAKAGGIFGRWIAGNDDGDYMADDSEILITPTVSGYYVLGCIGDAGGNDFGVGTFEIIAKQVAADTFGGDRSSFVDVESGGELVKPVSHRSNWEDQTVAAGQVDAETVDEEIVTNAGFKNFKGQLNHDGDEDYIKINLDIEKWYSFEVGGDVHDPKIELISSTGGWVTGGSEDGGSGLNGVVKYKPSAAGVYYLKISSDAPTYWGQGSSLGTGEYVVVVSGGDIGQHGHWLTAAGIPAPFGSTPSQDVPSGLNTTASIQITDQISGDIEIDGDRDWYKYSLVQGKIYRWTLNGLTLKKPSIIIRNSDGNKLDKYGAVVEANSGNVNVVQDKAGYKGDGTLETESTIVFVAGYTGDYFIEVFSDEDIDANNANTATGTFNLESRELFDDYGGAVRYADNGSGYLPNDGSGWPNYIPESYDFSSAGYLQAGRRADGTFYSVDDDDFFGVDLLNRNSYTFSIFPTTAHSGGDSYATITLYNSEGLLVDKDLGYNGAAGSFENLTPPADGYYYLKATSENDYSDQKGYTITTSYFGDDYSNNRDTNGILTEEKFVTGNLEANGDVDWVRVDLQAGERYEFKLESAPYGAYLKLNGSVENANLYVNRKLNELSTSENAYTADIGDNANNAHKFPLFDDNNITHVGGLISHGDKDWIAAELKEGMIYQFYLVGAPNNNFAALPDPKFSIFGPDGQMIRGANNNAGVSNAHKGTVGRDAEMLFTATESGTYYVEVQAETTTPTGNVVADGVAVNGASVITVDPLSEYMKQGTVLVFRAGATFTLSADALVTHTTLNGVLAGDISDDEIAYENWIIANQTALSGAVTIEVNQTAKKVFNGDVFVFSNGSTFTASQDADPDSTQLTGLLNGSLAASDVAYRNGTGRYSLAVVLLPTDVVAQHYHDVLSASEVKIDWTPRYTAPYFLQVGTHWGAKGEYKISMAKMADLASSDTVGETRDSAVTLNLGAQVTSTMEYAGDRDWYKVEMIPGESYRIDLTGDGVQGFDRQNPIIKILDKYGKPKGDLWKWKYDRKWGKPGGAWSESQSTSYVWSVPLNRFDHPIGTGLPSPKVYYLEASSNTAGDIIFTVTHLLDDQSESMTTTGVIEVGGTASGTWEMGAEDGANEDLIWGMHGGDGDWFKANLVMGNTYKIDIFSHHFNRPSIKMYTEAGVYFRDNQQHSQGDHDTSLFIETIKDGHAQMTFTANRTGVFFVNAWNIHTWDVTKGGSGNNIYDLSLVHIPDDIMSSINTSAVLPVDGQATASLEAVSDRDWFKVTLKRGGVYKFNLVGGSLKDPSLRIRDSHGNQLLYNDQINGWWNPTIVYTANEDGIYYVDVAGIDSGSYTVNCTSVYTPPVGTDNFIGSEIEVPSSVASTFLNLAQAHTIGNIVQDSIAIDGDRRWYKVDLKQARAYEFHQFGDSLQRPSLYLRDENGTAVFPPAKKDKPRSSGEKLVLTYEAPTTGTYYLDAGGFWASGYQQNGTVAGVPTGSFSIQTFDLGVATERALSWDQTFSGAVGGAVDLIVGAADSSGQLENAGNRDLFKVSLVEGATYRFRISGALVNAEVDRGVKTRLFLHNKDGEFIEGITEGDLDYKAAKSETYYIAVGATTGQVTGTNFRVNSVPYAYQIKLIQKRAPKTEPAVNWFATLNTVANDVLTAAVSDASDKKLDRTELLAILNSVKVGGITTDELTDLRILVANFKDLGLSNYLVTVLDSMVNGNPANQYYTGRGANNMGNTARQDLGNLYPNSSEDRVEKLISKWFLGTDSPAQPKLYVYLDLPLFFDGARATDVNQGSLGDCYLLSSLSAVAESTIASIDGIHASVYPGDMFVDNGDGTFGVRWYDNNGAERWVTVDKYVPGYRSEKLHNVNTTSGESWTMLAEKAYVQLNESDNIGQDGTNRYGIGNNFGIAGGSAVMALSHVSGQASSYKFISDSGDLAITEADLIQMIGQKLPMVFSTSAPCPLASSYGVKRKHTYTYESYDVATGKFFLRNPWGNTHAEVTFAALKHMGSNLAYLDGTRKKMQRIDPSESTFSVSDAASSPEGGGDSGLYSVETNGSIHLFKDDQSRLYAGAAENSSVPVTINGQSMTLAVSGRTVVAAENVNGVNQLLWKDDATNALESMNFNSAWQFVSSGNASAVSTSDFHAAEVAFNIDADSNGQIGDPNASDVAPTDLSLSPNIIAENMDTSSAVKVGDITVTDDGLSSVVLTIAGTDAANFEISGTALWVKYGVALDYETKASYSIDLVATDGVGSYMETVTVTVTDVVENTAPVANAGSAQTVDKGTTVTLDGGTSSDADTGDTLTYAWTAPTGITLTGATLANPTFTAPDVSQATDYTFSLTVSDGQADSTATVVVTVLAVDSTKPVITLTGDTTVSVDLGATYVDAGATASDDVDGNITSSISVVSTVDTSTVGTYTVTYTVSDAASNEADAVIRTVNVVQPTVTQSISLNSGWNLISFHVETADMAPATVLAPIQAKLAQIKNLTQSYDPSLPSFLNTLTSLNVKDGYWVKVTADASFDVVGTVPAGSSITVNSGWNLVGYPRAAGAAPAGELSSLGSTVVQIKNLTESYDPSLPSFLNTLTTMMPGLGYWLKVTADGTWTVGTVADGGAGRAIAKAQPTHSPEEKAGPAWGKEIVYPNLGATVLAQVSIQGKPVAKGGVVGAFVEGELRGLQGVVLDNGKSYVTLNVNLNGAEPVNYRVWNTDDQDEYPVSGTMLLKLGGVYGNKELVKLDAVAVAGESLKVIRLTREPFGFSFGTKAGLRYAVETTGDFRVWSEVDVFQGSGDEIRFTAKPTTSGEARYFRVFVK